MSIVIVASQRDVSEWKSGLESLAPHIEVNVWPDVTDPDSVEGAIVWNHPHGALNDYKNLKFISSMGAGVDHVFTDKHLPENVPVTRIIDERLTITMSNYIISAIMYFHRRLPKYLADKKEHRWDQAADPERELHIGIMGMGVMGKDIAKKLALLNFDVHGYSNSLKNIDGVKSYAGENQLAEFLKNINTLVCLLPLTTATENILNIGLFGKMKKGSFLINVARGKHLKEEDLLLAIKKEYISGAFIDVFREEPLPKDHPFWSHPDIMMTPHIASITNPSAAIPQVLENYERSKRGGELINQVNPERGY